jgi:hypothetical protein
MLFIIIIRLHDKLIIHIKAVNKSLKHDKFQACGWYGKKPKFRSLTNSELVKSWECWQPFSSNAM